MFILVMPTTLHASFNPTYVLGKLTPGKYKVVYGANTVNTYAAFNTNYIAVADLQLLGCNVGYDNATKTVTVSKPNKQAPATTSPAVNVQLGDFKINAGLIKVGYLNSQSIECNGRTFIPLATLGQFGSLSYNGDTCLFYPREECPVTATLSNIKNFSNETLTVTVLDIYWANKKPVTKEATYTVPAGESLGRSTTVAEGSEYLASVVQSALGETIQYYNRSQLGQLNVPLLNAYEDVKYQKSIVYTNDYGDKISTQKVAAVEKYVNDKGLSSSTKYLVWTNIEEQYTYIFQGSKGNWKLIKAFLCSTGKNSTPTPPGTYQLTRKVPSFGQDKGYCCKYAFGFIGTSYLYHSIIYDKTGSYLLENKGVLGRKASDGCIRFSTEHAKWFYDTMISGTTVYITD